MSDQLVVGTPGKVWTLINMKVLATDRLKVRSHAVPNHSCVEGLRDDAREFAA